MENPIFGGINMDQNIQKPTVFPAIFQALLP